MSAKKKNKLAIVLTVVLILVIGILGLLKIPGLWTEISFYWYDHTETELKVKAFAEENRIFYSEYPQSLIELLERNPETEDFVLNYPFRDEVAMEAFSYDLTRGVPLMMQWDPRWGYMKYGSDVVGITGCGPVCLAMAGYYVTEEKPFQQQESTNLLDKLLLPLKGT